MDMFADDCAPPKSAEQDRLEQALKSSDPRTQLLALRDYLINELTGNRCRSCSLSRLKESGTAALILRFESIMKEIASLPDPEAEDDPLQEIQRRRDNVVPIRPEAAS